MFIHFQTTMTKNPFELTIYLPAGGPDEDIDLFSSLKGSTLRTIPFFLSLHQQQISHEYCRRMFAIITMPRNDLQHFNWSSLVVSNPPVYTVLPDRQ